MREAPTLYLDCYLNCKEVWLQQLPRQFPQGLPARPAFLHLKKKRVGCRLERGKAIDDSSLGGLAFRRTKGFGLNCSEIDSSLQVHEVFFKKARKKSDLSRNCAWLLLQQQSMIGVENHCEESNRLICIFGVWIYDDGLRSIPGNFIIFE
jgi:hypothetical protein